MKNVNRYFKWILPVAAILFATLISCATTTPFEPTKFEANVFSVSNKSADTIMIEYSYSYLFEMVTDTSALVEPEDTCNFYYSDFTNGGPASLQSVMTTVAILVVVDGTVVYSEPVDLTVWEKTNYSDGNNEGTRYLYTYK